MKSKLNINSEYLLDVLTQLVNTPSPVGDTERGIELCRELICKFDGLDVQVTRKGALVAHWPGKSESAPRGVTAHVDTLGAVRRVYAELTAAGGPRVDVSGSAPPLPEPLATHAYRIGVEALTNAIRHAGATHVHARIGGHAEALVLDVCDDGGGFEPRPGRAGTGLQAMHSRAASLGGRLQVGPGPGGRGTRVHLEIPLQEGARP